MGGLQTSTFDWQISGEQSTKGRVQTVTGLPQVVTGSGQCVSRKHGHFGTFSHFTTPRFLLHRLSVVEQGGHEVVLKHGFVVVVQGGWTVIHSCSEHGVLQGLIVNYK